MSLQDTQEVFGELNIPLKVLKALVATHDQHKIRDLWYGAFVSFLLETLFSSILGIKVFDLLTSMIISNLQDL